jgi:SsrA-binding protein
MQKKDKIEKYVEIRNKKASFEYHFLETYTAGMVLQGTEIKSIRQGKVNMGDAYCFFEEGELWLKQLHISAYGDGTYLNHAPLRDRKLLLQKRELRKLEAKAKDVGLTIIPTRVFISERGFAKLDIALARGKKLYDKREDLKTRDAKREMARGE